MHRFKEHILVSGLNFVLYVERNIRSLVCVSEMFSGFIKFLQAVDIRTAPKMGLVHFLPYDRERAKNACT
jgi:hypothetical protein